MRKWTLWIFLALTPTAGTSTAQRQIEPLDRDVVAVADGDGRVAETYKLEGHKSDGTFLWRFDLGVNIRPGIWHSPFLVYDLGGDGRAEVGRRSRRSYEALREHRFGRFSQRSNGLR